MLELSNVKMILFCFGALVLFLQISSSEGQDQNPETGTMTLEPIQQDLGTGVDEERDVMDNCIGASGPRPINGVFFAWENRFCFDRRCERRFLWCEYH